MSDDPLGIEREAKKLGRGIDKLDRTINPLRVGADLTQDALQSVERRTIRTGRSSAIREQRKARERLEQERGDQEQRARAAVREQRREARLSGRGREGQASAATRILTGGQAAAGQQGLQIGTRRLLGE